MLYLPFVCRFVAVRCSCVCLFLAASFAASFAVRLPFFALRCRFIYRFICCVACRSLPLRLPRRLSFVVASFAVFLPLHLPFLAASFVVFVLLHLPFVCCFFCRSLPLYINERQMNRKEAALGTTWGLSRDYHNCVLIVKFYVNNSLTNKSDC